MSIDLSAEPLPAVAEQPLALRRLALPARTRGWTQIARCVTLAAVAGLLHAMGWLFVGSWYVVWVAQAALIFLGGSCRPRQAMVYGTLAGAVGIGLSFYWGVAALQTTFEAAPLVAWAVFLILVAIEAAAMGLFCLAVSIVANRGTRFMWLVPCAWVAIEHWYPRVFPWKMGYSQLEFLPLVQIAELVGPTGIGFVMTAVAAIPTVLVLGFWQPLPSRERRWASAYVASAGLLLAATLAFGYVRISQWSEWVREQPKLKLALVQVDPVFVGSEKKLRERSLAVHDQVDLLCWPESALGIYSERLSHFRDPAQTATLSRQSHDCLEPAKGLACHLLAGGKLYREGASHEGPYAMTAFLVTPDQDISGRYRKRTLLPFGEYIPGQSWFPALREWASLDDFVEAGSDPTPLVTKTGHRLGLVICYEDTLPRNARLTVAAGAEALFSLIQGTAFENRLTLVQHQRLAALRAVENRRYFVRCASTGMTCVVDPTGKTIAQLPPQVEGTLLAEIAPIRSRTVFNYAGDLFPIFCTLLGLGGMIASCGSAVISGPMPERHSVPAFRGLPELST